MIDLQQRFSVDHLQEIVESICPDFAHELRSVEFLPERFEEGVYLGSSAKLNLQIFALRMSGITKSRVGVANDGFRVMKNYGSSRAIVAFYSDSDDAWRLSLMSASPRIVMGELETIYSNPRRQSYVLGPSAKIATPSRVLFGKRKIQTVDELENCFALEVVNKDFYDGIARLYTQLVGGKRKIGSSIKSFKPQLKVPSRDSNSSDLHEFGVRLIGRLVFCWFLKEKRSSSGIALIPDSVLPRKMTDLKNIYSTLIEPLFFELLNKSEDVRKKNYRSREFSLVPYLNGGLFRPHEGTSGDYYKPGQSDVTVPDSWLILLFELLNQYNFTIDENTSYDVELSVDPEMLGRIFENLLAEINPETGETARKATGSFYTPRAVVDYMVDRALQLYLSESTKIATDQISALVSYDKIDDGTYPIGDNEKSQIVRSLLQFRSIDPACGSGAFPIGLLQKIVYILQQLDPDCELWLDEQLRLVPKELKAQLISSVKFKGVDYIRKLGIIKNCIYGVDIQPIAAEIARLRCLLTLIVDEEIHDDDTNRGIEPLPNLEFKFVAANSLLDLGAGQNDYDQTTLFEDETHIDELREIRDEYFSVSAGEREALLERFEKVQKKMRRKVDQNTRLDESREYRVLADWKPFANQSVDWFDPSWMFGIKKFDLVIMNPPYLGEKDHKEIFHAIKESEIGRFYSKNADIWYFFVHLALNLLKDSGHSVCITTNYFLTSTYGTVLRRDLKSRTSPVEFLNFNQLRIFDSAPGQHNVISIFKKTNKAENCLVITCNEAGAATNQIMSRVLSRDDDLTFCGLVVKADLFDGDRCYIRLPALGDQIGGPGEKVLIKMSNASSRLGNICHVNQGLLATPDKFKRSHAETFTKIKADVNDGIFVLNEDEARKYSKPNHLRPFFKNSDISRFVCEETPVRYVIYLTSRIEPTPDEIMHLEVFRPILEKRLIDFGAVYPWFSLHRPRDENVFESPKIVCPQRSKLNSFAYTEKSWYASADVYFIRQQNPDFSLKYILGLLNSRLYYFWLYHRGKRKGEMLELYQVPLSELPIPDVENETAERIEKLVERRLLLNNFDTESEQFRLESEIETEVHLLFGLSDEESSFVNDFFDSKARLSRF